MFYDEYVRLCNGVNKTPTAVAKEIGFAGAHVTKWKNGSTPTDATTFKICDYFNLPYDYFVRKDHPAVAQSKHAISDEDLMAAFFNGGAEDLTREEMAEMWDDARSYIQYKLEQKRRKNNG